MESTIKNTLEKLKDKKISPTNFSSDNILYLLGIHYNEVVICRLIKAIIEPNGFHGLGDIPFKFFMQNVLGVEDFEIKQPEIILEEKITDNRRVDIAIYNKGYVYPIEVKIWAKDQDRQLYDYYNYYKHKPDKTTIEKIYYLTPDGHDPSQESRGNLKDEIETISFKDKIEKYLNEDVLQRTKNDDCKNIINNFIEVIDMMNEDEKNINDFKDIFDDLKNDDKKSIFSVIKNADKKWEKCRDDFLKQSVEECLRSKYDEVKVSEVSKDFEEIDSHCIFVVQYANKKAYVCIDTNLYITIKDSALAYTDNWESYGKNSEYVWKYVQYEGMKGKDKKWNLKSIDENLFIREIKWGKYLP